MKYKNTLLTGALLFALGGAALGQNLPTEKEPTGLNPLEVVYTFKQQMPVGIAITSTGRRFVSYPRWEDQVAFTLAELKDDKEVPYPQDGAYQNGQKGDAQTQLVSLQGIVVDGQDRLWALDTGTINMKPITPFIPKLLCFDTKTNKQELLFRFPADVVPEGSYLNDLRVDLTRGAKGTIYITDSGEKPGIIVFDIATHKSLRRLTGNPATMPDKNFVAYVEGRPYYKRPKPGLVENVHVGADGIAISPDGKTLYFIPNSSRRMYSVSTDALSDPKMTDAQVAATVQLLNDNSVSDGLGEDTTGRIYFTNWEHNAILRRYPNGLMETVVADPRLLWPDTLCLGKGGWLYVISNQLHRQPSYNEGKDIREKPYSLMRIQVGSQGVALTPGTATAQK